MPSRQSSQRHTSSPNASEPRLLVESSESVRRSRLTMAAGLPPIAMAAAVNGVASCVESVLLPLLTLAATAAGVAAEPVALVAAEPPLAAAAASILRASSCSISVRGRDEDGNNAIALNVGLLYCIRCLSRACVTSSSLKSFVYYAFRPRFDNCTFSVSFASYLHPSCNIPAMRKRERERDEVLVGLFIKLKSVYSM